MLSNIENVVINDWVIGVERVYRNVNIISEVAVIHHINLFDEILMIVRVINDKIIFNIC